MATAELKLKIGVETHGADEVSLKVGDCKLIVPTSRFARAVVADIVGDLRPVRAASVPPIGQQWSGEGGIYAGIARGTDEKGDYHLIVGPEYDGELKWDEAMKWAGEQKVDGHEFGLPTRKEQALMFANVPELFKSEWYWSNAQHAEYTDYAWMQDFGYGDQGSIHKSYSYRVRAVRRLPI